MTSSFSRPLDVHVTPRGRIILIPAVWPPDIDADQADDLAAQLTDAAARSRAATCDDVLLPLSTG